VLLLRGVTDAFTTRSNRPLDALWTGAGRVAPRAEIESRQVNPE